MLSSETIDSRIFEINEELEKLDRLMRKKTHILLKKQTPFNKDKKYSRWKDQEKMLLRERSDLLLKSTLCGDAW